MDGTLRDEFKSAVGNKSTMDYQDFMEIVGCKNSFFAQRMFHTIDTDNSGDITYEEFWAAVGWLQSRGTKASAEFLFKMIDTNNNGTLQVAEIKKILEASLEESGSSFTAKELQDLAHKLRDMFLELREPDEVDDNITFEEFERVMLKYPDVLNGLSLEGMNTRNKRSQIDRRKKKKNVVHRTLRWIHHNPQLSFTYGLLYGSIVALYFWMFYFYAGNCEGVDLTRVDSDTGLSRADVMEFANEWRSQRDIPLLTVQDMKYMSFSRDMGSHDPPRCQTGRRRILLTWMLPIAKGAGQGMKGTFTIILLPVSRNLMTFLQRTFLRHFFPFHDAVEIHKDLGRVGFFLAWLHTLCYVVIVYRWQDIGLYKEWSWAFAKYSPDRAAEVIQGDPEADLELFEGIPSYLFRNPADQPSALSVIGTWFGITGVILIVIYTIACLFALDYPKKLKMFDRTKADSGKMSWGRIRVLALGRSLRNFNNFWYTHHLFAIFYVCLLLHPLPNIPNGRNEWGGSDSWLWAAVPILLYALERVVRFLRAIGSNEVAVADIYKGNVVHLKVRKPFMFEYSAGMYGFINIPELSAFEWHPFTFTSSPGDDYLGFHIRAAGDWTQALYDMVKMYKADKAAVHDVEEGLTPKKPSLIRTLSGKPPAPLVRSLSGVAGPETVVDHHIPFTVNVDGPFGAPAQDYKKFKVLILVGAGIGVTPFASVLNDLLDYIKTNKCVSCGHSSGHKKIKKVYFYWTTRMRSEVVWFKNLLEELAVEDTQGLLDINIHLTSFPNSKDVRMVLLHLAQTKVAEVEGVDILSDVKTSAITKFGRPEWDDVFSRATADFPKEKNVGVFFCGPNPLARVLRTYCKKYSNSQKKYHLLKESFG